MSLLSELNAKRPAPYFAAILNQFPSPNIAQKLGVSTGYVRMLMTGVRTPGPALARRIDALVAAIEAEMAVNA